MSASSAQRRLRVTYAGYIRADLSLGERVMNAGVSIRELIARLCASLAIERDSHSKPMVCTVAVGHTSVAARIVREAVVDMSPVNHR